jgi:hypothetical protein
MQLYCKCGHHLLLYSFLQNFTQFQHSEHCVYRNIFTRIQLYRHRNGILLINLAAESLFGNWCAMFCNWCAMQWKHFIYSNLIPEFVTHNQLSEVIIADTWRDFWIRETGTAQQVANLNDRYDEDDDDNLLYTNRIISCVYILSWKWVAHKEFRPLDTKRYHVISITTHETANAYPNSKTQEAACMCVTLI